MKKESDPELDPDPDPLIRDTDPDQNVTAPQHWPSLTYKVHDTCRDESIPPCRRVSDMTHPGSIVAGHQRTGIHLCGGLCDFPPFISLIAIFWHQIFLVLAFFRSSSYFLMCKRPRLKASLPCPVRHTSTFLLDVESTLHNCFLKGIKLQQREKAAFKTN